jgi:hypothetical protein
MKLQIYENINYTLDDSSSIIDKHSGISMGPNSDESRELMIIISNLITL